MDAISTYTSGYASLLDVLNSKRFSSGTESEPRDNVPCYANTKITRKDPRLRALTLMHTDEENEVCH